MTTNLMAEGLTLTALGMGTVFVFLTVLVIAMTILKKLMEFFPEPEPAAVTAKAPVISNDAVKVAAVAAAVHAFQQRR
jgi:oxaloacetate decarboxylase (Na+ extruding) subunit gamma